MRRWARSERGYTLVELLVAILILGILVAIAIPSFLSMTNNGYDAGAKELARTAETTAASIGTDNYGSYASITGPASLVSYETTIQTNSGVGDAWLVGATGSSQGFTVDAEAASSGYIFQISRLANGSVVRTCGTTLGATGVVDTGQTGGGCTAGNW
jgi:type IV pilus assembly protein PilA